MLCNTRTDYGLVAKLLHWTVAALIVGLLALGVYMHELPASNVDEAARKYWYYSLHKTIGITALLLATIRVLWACIQTSPVPLNSEHHLENLAARTVHWVLYGAIVVMPVTGWLHHAASTGFAPIWWPLPQDLPLVAKSERLAIYFSWAHVCTAWLLVLALAMHIAGALKHAFIDRDETLSRMLAGASPTHVEIKPEKLSPAVPAVLTVLAFLAVIGAATVLDQRITATPTGRSTVLQARDGRDGTWLVDYARSRLEIVVKQSGQPVAGHFQRWSAKINLDPHALDDARIVVAIDIASLSLGGVSNEAISQDFLNAAAHPTARFVAESVVAAGEDTYQAIGTLSLAGQNRPLTLPFNLKITNDRAAASASVTIDRLSFGIGKAGYPGGGLVGIDVVVKIRIEANRAPSS